MISGLSARRPTIVSLARELRALVEKLRERVEGILRRRANIFAIRGDNKECGKVGMIVRGMWNVL